MNERRAQFTIGPEYFNGDQWKKLVLSGELKLSVEKDLELTQIEAPHATLTLLGYILDWSKPDASNKDILSSLLHEAKTFDECISNTSELGGRWILIYDNSEDIILFHDMGGLRQVCFTEGHDNGPIFCASQCDLLADISGLLPDSEALTFIEGMAATNPEYWWPGNSQPYKHAKALLPNHWLNLKNGVTQRYWPVTERKTLSMAEVIPLANRRITGIIEAAANRYELVLGLSAGLDSRLLLAASKIISSRLSIYNARSATQKSSHADAVIPEKLCKKLGLPLTEIEIPDKATDTFLDGFKKHSWHPREKFSAGIEIQRDIFAFSKMAVIGNLGEIAKLPYRHKVTGETDISAELLASCVKMNNQRFAIDAIKAWSKSIDNTQGYELLDLFYWEQRVGRWLATNQIEFDYGWMDILAPLNIRALMCDLLAIDEENREMANHQLFLSMIQELWPETLEYPINPVETPSFLTQLKQKLKHLLKKHSCVHVNNAAIRNESASKKG
ncbi:MAG: hypothetical protein CMO98_10745 [Woeseia sp.]|nr:hypothetical protein [Woeseia sp.]|tara:strand:- start:1607 stop:3112 length:1506 start_codon:yes stop_codon:yes gene_type:complete